MEWECGEELGTYGNQWKPTSASRLAMVQGQNSGELGELKKLL